MASGGRNTASAQPAPATSSIGGDVAPASPQQPAAPAARLSRDQRAIAGMLYSELGDLYTPPSFREKVIKMAVPLISSDQAEFLRELSLKYRTAREALHANVAQKIHFQHRENLKSISRELESGKFDSMSEYLPTKEETMASAESKRTLLKTEVRRISALAIPTVAERYEKLGKFALKLHDELRAKEEFEADRLGLPYRPSFTVVSLGQLVFKANRLAPKPPANFDPADYLIFAK
jgi:hypothetical protein